MSLPRSTCIRKNDTDERSQGPGSRRVRCANLLHPESVVGCASAHHFLRQCPAGPNPAKIPFLRLALPILAIALLASCSARPKQVAETKKPPATRPADISLLPLDEIEPRPRLAELNSTTQPTTKPSLQALQLFAQGRAFYQDREATKAVESLRRALELDRNSPEINYALALAYIAAGAGSDTAIGRLERAT